MKSGDITVAVPEELTIVERVKFAIQAWKDAGSPQPPGGVAYISMPLDDLEELLAVAEGRHDL